MEYDSRECKAKASGGSADDIIQLRTPAKQDPWHMGERWANSVALLLHEEPAPLAALRVANSIRYLELNKPEAKARAA